MSFMEYNSSFNDLHITIASRRMRWSRAADAQRWAREKGYLMTW